MINGSIVQYNDTTGKYAGRSNLLTPLINAAIADLNKFIVSKDVTLELAIEVKSISSYASAGAAAISWDAAGNLPGVRESLTDSAQVKIREGLDWTAGAGALAADINITLSPSYMDDVIRNSASTSTSALSQQQATMEHEISHGMGFYSLRDKTTGALPDEFQSLFDAHVVIEAGKPYFAGDAAVAMYGGRVPLTGLGSTSALSHIDKGAFLMGPSSGAAQMSQVEMAMFHDIGYSLKQTLVSPNGRNFVVGDGRQSVTGTAAIDTALIDGRASDYTLVRAGGEVVLTSIADPSDVISLSGVERVKFDDTMMAIDATGNGGQAYRLYQAALNRTPDKAGLGFQMNALDSGHSLAQVAQNFINSPEFTSTYGSLNDTQFVTQLYQNVLHRTPDAGGLDYHVKNLAIGVTRAQTLVGFSESPENQAALIGVIQNGMEFTSVA